MTLPNSKLISILCIENSAPFIVDSKPTVTTVPWPVPWTLGVCISVPPEYSTDKAVVAWVPWLGSAGSINSSEKSGVAPVGASALEIPY